MAGPLDADDLVLNHDPEFPQGAVSLGCAAGAQSTQLDTA